AGRIPGPKIHLTGPYLQGAGSYLLQLHTLTGPDDAVKLVNYWADIGFTSFKAYTDITREQLGAAIKAAHARGLKVTGHLCSVTFKEAADLGIDSLEHGLSASTDHVPGKQLDTCPVRPAGYADPPLDSTQIQDLITHLVSKKVAIVSTLPVAEAGAPNRPPRRRHHVEELRPQRRTVRRAGLGHRQRRHDRHLLAHQVRDQILDLRRVERRLRVTGRPHRALIELLARHVIGAGAEPVLEAVDAEIGRLAEGHRAEMSGHLQAARVRRLDRGAEL